MPLRDHFRSPLDDLTAWEGFHGGWPMMIVLSLSSKLPRQYVAAPRVHSGSYLNTDRRAQDEYEVRISDSERGRHLVAAIEIVSPANKDRPEHRSAFVAKCAALLQERVSVTIIDLVTTRNFNFSQELLELLDRADPSLGDETPPLYAVACRTTKKGNDWQLETWAQTLTVGQPLPTLPLWLADNLAVPLELESSYEATCQALRLL
jgi:hypothetical protein